MKVYLDWLRWYKYVTVPLIMARLCIAVNFRIRKKT